MAALFLAAYFAPPIAFLVGGAVAIMLGGFALLRTLTYAWRMGASSARAAAIADERGALKGRLATLVELADAPRRGPLWSYLVEDTLARRDEFEPARIERRRVSRTVYSFLASLVAASLSAALILAVQRAAPRAARSGNDFTIDLDRLQLRPAEPGFDSGVEVRADAETMRRLEEKLAREGLAQGPSGSFDRLMDQARELGSNFQSKLTGRERARPRINLKLADSGVEARRQPAAPSDQTNRAARKRNEGARQFEREKQDDARRKSDARDDSTPSRRHDDDELSGDLLGSRGLADEGAGDDSDARNADGSGDSQGEHNGSGGVARGLGAEPETLFGRREPTKLGGEGFEIAIEARPMDAGVRGAGSTLLPPKVRTPLNPTQYPDEPVARAAVPAEDRDTIKRVFER
ncbi:MAG: hypothetical protein ACREQB_04175 [Candidatus Binataceae bacterium]